MIEDRVAQLEAELAALRAALDEANSTRDRTMEGQRRCPGCGCRVLFHVDRVPDQGGWSGALALLVNAGAELEVYACARCGLVEWYVARPQDLVPDGVHISLIGKERAEPFR